MEDIDNILILYVKPKQRNDSFNLFGSLVKTFCEQCKEKTVLEIVELVMQENPDHIGVIKSSDFTLDDLIIIRDDNKEGKGRLGEVRLGEVRLGEVRLGEVRLG